MEQKHEKNKTDRIILFTGSVRIF